MIENWIVRHLCKSNICVNFTCTWQFSHLHAACNLQLDLIKTGFHHAANFAFSWFHVKVIRRVPESLPFARYLPRNFERIFTDNTILWLFSINVLEFMTSVNPTVRQSLCFQYSWTINESWQICDVRVYEF